MRFDYSNACTRYGASMGRDSTPARDLPQAAKWRLQRVPLNSGGYDPGGAYWGSGEPLWRAETDGPTQDDRAVLYLRAPSRDAAKQAVQSKAPGATFWR